MTIEEGEIYSLKWWFDNDYTRKEQKYRRLIALGDISVEPLLLALYQEAEVKRAVIKKADFVIMLLDSSKVNKKTPYNHS